MLNLYQPYRIRFADRQGIAPVARPVEKKMMELGMPPSMRPRRPASRRRRALGAVGAIAFAATAIGATIPAGDSRVPAGQPIMLDPIIVTVAGPVRLDPLVVTAARPVVLDPLVVTVTRSAVVAPTITPAPAVPEEMRIVVNLPAYRLDVYRGDAIVRTFPVTIGAPGYETPTGKYVIDDIIFNPWWHPPASDWAVGKSPVGPGPENPMGRAKLNFAPLLYIHGSTNVAALGTAGSHGCVRLSNDDILELARIVQAFAAPDSAAIVDPLVANPGRTHQLNLDRRVSLEIRYDVAEVYGGELKIHEDVYGLWGGGLADEVRAVLIRAGESPGAIDTGSLVASGAAHSTTGS